MPEPWTSPSLYKRFVEWFKARNPNKTPPANDVYSLRRDSEWNEFYSLYQQSESYKKEWGIPQKTALEADPTRGYQPPPWASWWRPKPAPTAAPVGEPIAPPPQLAPAQPETLPPEGTGQPEVVSKGGYDFMAIRDLDGNIVSWEVIEKTPPKPGELFDAYIKWVRETYGGRIADRIKTRYKLFGEDYTTSEYYKYWDKYGKPGFREAEKPLTPKQIAKLSPEEYAEYYQGLLRGEAQPYWAAPEGAEWHRPEFDPQTGIPLQERQWGLRAAEEEVVPSRTVIEQEGIYDVLVAYDSEGNRHVQAVIGKTPSEVEDKEGLTPWEEAQLAEKRAERQWEANKIGLSRAMQHTQAFWTRMGAPRDTGTNWAEKAKQFEELRHRALSSLGQSPDLNWLQIEQERLKPNPFEEQRDRPDTSKETIAKAREEEKIASQLVKDLERSIYDKNSTQSMYAGQTEDVYRTALGAQQLARDRLVQAEAKSVGINLPDVDIQGRINWAQRAIVQPEGEMGWDYSPGGGRDPFAPLDHGMSPQQLASEQSRISQANERDYSSWMPPPEPKGVEVPKFLRQFVPGLTGKYIPGTGTMGGTAPQAITPSPQSWARTPLKQQRQFAGYTKFAGQDYEQLLRQMGQMIPQRPSLGRNWAAFGQRG